MKYFGLILSLSMIYTSGFGQNKITGKVVEKNTNNPIPAVSIQVIPSENGTATNTQGIFTLYNLPSDCRLYFTSIGYKDTLVDLSCFKSNTTIFLAPQAYTLPEFCVYPKQMGNVKLGIRWYTDVNGERHSKKNSQYVVYLPNKEKRNGYLNSFSLKIPSSSRWDCPFKLRVMKVDTTFQTIGIPMLPKDIEVKATRSGWCEVDLSSYRLPIPKDGFVISIIVYDAGDEYFYRYIKGRKDIANYGIGIYMSTHPHDALPWGYIWNEKRFGICYSYKRYYYAVRATLKVIQ